MDRRRRGLARVLWRSPSPLENNKNTPDANMALLPPSTPMQGVGTPFGPTHQMSTHPVYQEIASWDLYFTPLQCNGLRGVPGVHVDTANGHCPVIQVARFLESDGTPVFQHELQSFTGKAYVVQCRHPPHHIGSYQVTRVVHQVCTRTSFGRSSPGARLIALSEMHTTRVNDERDGFCVSVSCMRNTEEGSNTVARLLDF